MNIELQKVEDEAEIETLLDECFGKDRFEKASYGLREGVESISSLSFIIREEQNIVATNRFWPIRINNYPSLLLGPLAVLPRLRGKGYGISLMEHGLNVAKELGYKSVILVGDEPYYKKLGFSRDIASNLLIDGQEDRTRILGLELAKGALKNAKGMILKG